MRTPWTGVGTALVTPFTKSGELDEAGVRRLARRQIDAGVHFLVPCGTTGETPTLSEAERRRVVELVRRGSQRPGAGDGRRRRLRHPRSGARRARDAAGGRQRPALGDAVLQQAHAGRAVPALLGGRRRDARCRSCSTTCPAAPAATSRRPRVARLATIPHIVGVKEASGNIPQMAEILPRRADQLPWCCRATMRSRCR